MELPEIGYISPNINHLTSMPILLIMPLAILFAVCYWFRKRKKSIKEKGQGKWRLLPIGFIMCVSIMLSMYGGGKYFTLIS